MPGRMELTEFAELSQRLLESDQSGPEDILCSFGAGILGLLRRRFRDVWREAAAVSPSPMLPDDRRPRLVSATTNELPRPIRIPAIAALIASMLALVLVIVLTPETPSPSA